MGAVGSGMGSVTGKCSFVFAWAFEEGMAGARHGFCFCSCWSGCFGGGGGEDEGGTGVWSSPDRWLDRER